MNTKLSATVIAMAVTIIATTFSPARGGDKSPEVIRLSSDAHTLKSQFNQDKGHSRLLLLVSPICPACVKGARVIQEDVLNNLDDESLRVYVVWEPILPGDSFERAQKSARLVTDPRVKHFWVPDRELAVTFMKPLGLKKMPAWDVYLAYPQETTWNADVPDPAFFNHQLPQLPSNTRLDGNAFARQLKSLLMVGASGAPRN